MRLLIADDHTLFRDALVQYIERADPSSHVVLAKDFHEAMSLLEKDADMDLVILDLRMPGMDGLEGFRSIKARYPALRMALMSGVAESKDVDAALEIGAAGYFPKTLSGRALLQAIEKVVAGDIYVPKDGDGYMPSFYADNARNQAQISAFTPRESEVLSYLVDGASNKEIARALDVQVVTVKLHVRGVCRKLNAKNRTQAALKAKEMGIVPISQSN
ncbi:MAG: response regulator [Alcanivorax sp.]|jgi:two-component system nitrate/nitrite response regulator NarL